MKKTTPKISYDSDSDVLALSGAAKGVIDHAYELGNFVVHFTKDDEPLLIEVLEASEVFSTSPKTVREMVAPAFA